MKEFVGKLLGRKASESNTRNRQKMEPCILGRPPFAFVRCPAAPSCVVVYEVAPRSFAGFGLVDELKYESFMMIIISA